MFRRNELESALVLAGVSNVQLAKSLCIDKSTLYRKLNGVSEWTLSELRCIGCFVGQEKLFEIFFDQKVS